MPVMVLSLTPAVRAVLLANLVVFFAAWFLGADRLAPLELWPIAQDAGYAGLAFMPWQLISYAFLHFGFGHLFWNMLGLLAFGPTVERQLGSRRFQGYYFTCVVGAALAQLLVAGTLQDSPEPTIGASGGIYGVALAYALLRSRDRVVLRFTNIGMPAWLPMALLVTIELYEGVFGRNEGVAHFAHLGGVATGLVLLQYWRLAERRLRR